MNTRSFVGVDDARRIVKTDRVTVEPADVGGVRLVRIAVETDPLPQYRREIRLRTPTARAAAYAILDATGRGPDTPHVASWATILRGDSPLAAEEREMLADFVETLAGDVEHGRRAAVLAEREACAKVAEDESNDPPPYSDPDGNIVDASSDEIRRAIAIAIRERTKPRCRCGHDPCECG